MTSSATLDGRKLEMCSEHSQKNKMPAKTTNFAFNGNVVANEKVKISTMHAREKNGIQNKLF
jgi:hypothetical protein